MKRIFLLLALTSISGVTFAASVNGVAIADQQIATTLKQSGLADSAETRAAIKNQLIARELLRQEATRKNYTTRPEARQAADAARDHTAVELYLREAIKPAPVTDAQVKARFDAIVATLGEKEFKARVIALAEAATAASLLDKIRAGADFARLARDHSRAPSAARGGELDWVSFKLPLVEGATQGYPLALAQAISQLPVGGVSASIPVGGQFFLVKVDEVRAATVPKFEEVAPTLRELLQRLELERATVQLVADLIKNAKVQP